MWGEKVSADKINFEWPTLETLDQMDKDVSMKSLTLKDWDQCGFSISSVKVTLSNNKRSPVIENSSCRHFNEQTLNFDPQRPIRKVAAYSYSQGFYQLDFKDSSGSIVCTFNPHNRRRAQVECEIAEHETLVGVYGVKD